MKREMRDRRGVFTLDTSRARNYEEVIPSRIELIPFDPGDARVTSFPAEMLVTAAGKQGRLDHGLIALRVDQISFHRALDPGELRKLADVCIQMAAMIEGGE